MIARVIHGDCTVELPKLRVASVDAVVTDPIYPCINRSYGTVTERDWHAMMDAVVPECRRVLKPTGSAVFILQPNAKRAGEMRLWLWEFVVKWGREWGLVQDVYWWNYAQLPVGGATQQNLMRSSVKMCVWLGPHDCYRDQDAVLWGESETSAAKRLAHEAGRRASLFTSPSAKRRDTEGSSRLDSNRAYSAARRRGGVTPFNLLPASNTSTQQNIESFPGRPHAARTSSVVTDWWVRYLCPPGGTVLDPFAGTGGTLVSAVENGRNAVGIEKDAGYATGAAEVLRQFFLP